METPEGDSNLNILQPAMNQQNRSSLDGPVAILWDIENCRVPNEVCPEDVAGNIRMALQGHPVIKGAVKMFSAYGDFNTFPRHLREGCQRTGVKLIDVPNGRKDAADKAILIDMFLFALDNPPPSSILLISGDVDFAPALHTLGQRGYMVILVIPSDRGVSSALCNAGKFVWDWPSVARGEGFFPRSKALKYLRGGPTELDGYFMRCHINDNLDGQNEEESIVYGDISLSYFNSRDFSIIPQSLSEYTSSSSTTGPAFPATLKSHILPYRLIEASGCPVSHDDSDTMWVRPGDINGLKEQLVKLLELSGGSLLFSRFHAEYQKMFGRPLHCKDYGPFKLVGLIKKMGDAMAIDGKGQTKVVYLQNWKASPNVSHVLERKEKKREGTQDNGLLVGNNSVLNQPPRLALNVGDIKSMRQRQPPQQQQQQQPQLPFPKQANVAFAPPIHLVNSTQLASPGTSGSMVGIGDLPMNNKLVQSNGLQNGGMGIVGLGSLASKISPDVISKNNMDTSSLSPVPYMFGRGRKCSAALEKVVERRQRKMIKNRESAARPRACKQAYTLELEAKLAKLKELNEELQRKQEEMMEMQKSQILEKLHLPWGGKRQCLRRTLTGPG